jgi:uncharacterized repeat protein (TIGR04076 family)
MPVSAWGSIFGMLVIGVITAVFGFSYARSLAVQTVRAVLAQVTIAQGICPLGLRLGDVIRFAPDGSTSADLCAPARTALVPFVQATRRGEQLTNTACCPIWEHLLGMRFSLEEARAA